MTRFVSTPDADMFVGGPGSDTVSYESSSRPVIIDLAAQLTWDGVVNDVLVSIENAVGSKFDDKIYGSATAAGVLDGGDGGSDLIVGGSWLDTVSYESTSTGGVIIDLTAHKTWDGTSNDTLVNIDRAIGSRFDDTIYGDRLGDSVLDGGDGGADRLLGSDNSLHDMVSYASSTSGRGVIIDLDVQLTWDGTSLDTLGSIEGATGSRFDDTIFGSNAFDNRLDGGDGGNDFIKGSPFRQDRVSYASSTSGHGVIIDLVAQVTWDGSNHDTLVSIENATGSPFDDTIYSSNGVNVIDGGAGIDTVVYSSQNDNTIQLIDLQAGQARFGEMTAQGFVGVVDTLGSVENVVGSFFTDTIIGNDRDNILNGSRGNDIMTGGRGADRFVIVAGEGVAEELTDYSWAQGDVIVFVGFGPGATFTYDNDLHWTVRSASGLISEGVYLDNAPASIGYLFQ